MPAYSEEMTIISPTANRDNDTRIRRHIEVLVGIVTHNRHSELKKAIESALQQSYSQCRVVVLDDGSDDETPTLASKYPGVRWLRWESSQGYLAARNYLMLDTDSDFYLSLDDDAWFTGTDEIGIAVQHMEKNPRVAAVAFDILSPDRRTPCPRSSHRLTHMFIGCGHLLRMSAVRECGFYVPAPGRYGAEEVDMCLRLFDRGWEIHYLPGVHIWHDKSAVARDIAGQYRSGVCNDLVLAARRCPFPLVIGVIPFKFLSHIRFAAKSNLTRACWEGLGLFVRRAGDVWRSREPVRTGTYIDWIRLSYKS